MFIAKEKRRANIAEYVLYMWHVEDLIRACAMDMTVIEEKIIKGFKVEGAQLKELTEWYESLVHMMRQEGIAESGHLQMTKNTLASMEELHSLLLKASNHADYVRMWFQAKTNIAVFKSKSSNLTAPDTETCLNALYSLLLLKMAGKEISEATLESMETFSKMLAMLSVKYKAWEDGTLELKD